MTQDAPAIADIARGLTKAQRDAIVGDKRFGKSETWMTFEGLENGPCMEKCGWMPKFGGHNLYRATPLGLAVRAHLLKDRQDG